VFAAPPFLSIFTDTTNVVANTTKLHTIISGNAGQAYRIVTATLLLPQNAPATALVRILIRSVGPIVNGGSLVTIRGRSDHLIVPEPGALLGVGGELALVSISDSAALVFTIEIYYYIDTIT